MIIDDISIKMLDGIRPSIYRPVGADLGPNRRSQDSTSGTSTGDDRSTFKFPQIVNNNNNLQYTDLRSWTTAEYLAKIEELKKEKMNQENYMKTQECSYSSYRELIEDTNRCHQNDKNDAYLKKLAMEEIAKKTKEYNQSLKKNLLKYDNAKIITEMETQVAEDLRRQVSNARKRHERLLKKEKMMRGDLVLGEAYNEAKLRHEAAEERNERLQKKMNWYDTQLNKLHERLNTVKPPVSKRSVLPDIPVKATSNNAVGRSEMENITSKSQCVKLPAIPEANNEVASNIDNVDVLQINHIPHPPNKSNNHTASDSPLPHPPTKNENGTKRFVRKYKKGIT